MATTVTTRPPSNPPKMRPPPPSPLQTSINISTNTTAHSVGSKRPPSISSTPTTSTSAVPPNGITPKSAPKKKDSQKLAPSGTGAKSGNSEQWILRRKKLKESYVRTSEDVLRKFTWKPPSLVLHLYTNHFRFDQQDGSFGYHSPMRIILEHIKAETVPHDMLEELRQGNVPFYDGCLIVEIHDHKSIPATTKDTTADGAESTTRKPFSIHNYNEHITPSPHVPYPPRKSETQPRAEIQRAVSVDALKPIKEEPGASQSETMPPPPTIPTTSTRQPKIFTRVLHPTPLSRHRELTYLATTAVPEPRNRRAKDNATPLSAAPSTPLTAISTNSSKSGSNKRLKMMLEEKDMHEFESLAIRSTEVPLFLEPATDFEDAMAIMKSLTHPLHDQVPSKTQGRKRTTAELAADEAQLAEEERTLLIMDERIKPTAAGVATGEGLSAADEFQPNFARFKAFEDIRTRHLQEQAERAQREAKAREEAKIMQEQQQIQSAEKLKQEQQHQQQEKPPQASMQRQNVTQTNGQPAQMRPNAAAMQQLNQQQQNQQMLMMQASLLQQQQQATQGHMNSPMMQNGTPVNAGSPSLNQIGSVPMGLSMSGQGMGPGSPPRPGSALQMQAAANQIAMARQASQQPSHPSLSRHGTPQVPQMTPMMSNGMPMNHMTPQGQQRVNQGSPPPMGMQGTPMMNMMTPHLGQPTMQQQQQAMMMQQQQRRAIQAQAQAAQANAHAQAQMQGSPPNPSQMSPQHQAMLQAQMAQQMSSSPHLPNGQPQMQGTPTPGMIQQNGAARAAEEYRRQAGAQAAGRIMQLQRQNNMQQNQQANFNPGTPGMNFPNGAAMTPSMSQMAHNPAQAQFLAAQQAAQQQSQQQAAQQAAQQQMNMQQMPQQQMQQGFPQPPQGQQQQHVSLATAQQQLMARQKDKEIQEQFYRHLAKQNNGTIPPDAPQKFLQWRTMQTTRNRQLQLQQYQANMQQQHPGGMTPGQVLQNGMNPNGMNPNGAMNPNGMVPNGMNPNGAMQQNAMQQGVQGGMQNMTQGNGGTAMHQLAQLQYRQKLQHQSQMMGDQQRQAQAQAMAQARSMMANGQIPGGDVGMMNGMGRGGG